MIELFQRFELAKQMFLIVLVKILLLNLFDGSSDPRLPMYGLVHLSISTLSYLLSYIVDLSYIFLVNFNYCLLTIDLNPP